MWSLYEINKNNRANATHGSCPIQKNVLRPNRSNDGLERSTTRTWTNTNHNSVTDTDGMCLSIHHHCHHQDNHHQMTNLTNNKPTKVRTYCQVGYVGCLCVKVHVTQLHLTAIYHLQTGQNWHSAGTNGALPNQLTMNIVNNKQWLRRQQASIYRTWRQFAITPLHRRHNAHSWLEATVTAALAKLNKPRQSHSPLCRPTCFCGMITWQDEASFVSAIAWSRMHIARTTCNGNITKKGLIILITMLMVLSSWRNHCQSWHGSPK